jgi:hypothetical protein
MPVGQPASEGSEKHEGCNQEKGDRVDTPARLAGGKKPLHEANQDEFCRILVEGHLRLRTGSRRRGDIEVGFSSAPKMPRDPKFT